MELFKLQTDKIPEANLSDLNPLKMFSNLFQSKDNLTETVSGNDNDKKIKELMDKYTNQLTLERGEFEGKHKFKGTDYAARDFYNLGSMELQGLGTDGEQSGRVFFQPSNMGRANDKFRYNIGGFKNVYMSRKELNEYFGFPPNHDLTPEQIASFDPLAASRQSVAGTALDDALGVKREKYVAPPPKPDKRVEAGTIKDKDKRKAALDKAYKAQQEKDKFKDPAPKPKYKVKGDKADVKSYVDVNKEEKKKDPFADLSADRGTGGYRGGRATGGLVSRRKSKKKT